MQAVARPIRPRHGQSLWHRFLVYMKERARLSARCLSHLPSLFQIREHGCPALPLSSVEGRAVFCLDRASVVEVNVAGKRFTYSGCGNTGEGGAGMSNEFGKNGGIVTCGVSISPDGPACPSTSAARETAIPSSSPCPRTWPCTWPTPSKSWRAPPGRSSPRSHDHMIRSRSGIAPGAARQKDLDPGHRQSLWHELLVLHEGKN